MSHSAFIRSCLVLCAGILCEANINAQELQFRTIALTGAQGTSLGFGPNIAGYNFSSFGLPTLNSRGDVAFSATVTGPSQQQFDGVWKYSVGGLSLVASNRAAGPGPGVETGINFGSFAGTNPILSDSGDIAFYQQLPQAPSSSNTGIWTVGTGTPQLLAREGTSAGGPNLGSGIFFNDFNLTSGALFLSAQSTGEISFSASVTGTGNDSSIWSGKPNNLHLIAQQGTETFGPGLGPGVTFSAIDKPLSGITGHTTFWGRLGGAGIDSTNIFGIWQWQGDHLSLIARTGLAGPGPNLAPGDSFNFFNIAPEFGLNAAGQVSFVAFVSGADITASNDSGIWSTVGGQIHAVIREGDQVPGFSTGTLFGHIAGGRTKPVMNAHGDIAFVTLLTGPGVDFTNDSGLFANIGGSVQMIAREASQSRSTHSDGDTATSTPVINARGQVAFIADYIETPSGPGDKLALYVWSDGNLQRIVGMGDLFDFNPDPILQNLHSVTGVTLFTDSGGEDGRRRSLNDDGFFTFQLTYSGGGGIFTVQVPEPNTWLTTVSGITGILLIQIVGKARFKRRGPWEN